MSASVLQLFVLRDGQLAWSEVFAEGVYRVGRDLGCDLVLEDAEISPLHALLRFERGEVVVLDRGSVNGLYLNGAATREARVASGDDVHIGPFLLKTRVLGRKAADEPAAPERPPALRPPANPDDLRPAIAATAKQRIEEETAGEWEAAEWAAAVDAAVDSLAAARSPAPSERPQLPLAAAAPAEAHFAGPLPPAPAPPPADADANADALAGADASAHAHAHADAPAPAPAPRSRTKLRSSAPDLLHARLFWGDALLLARAFEPQRPVFGLPGDQDLLAQHGFSSANARPLVATAGDAWTVSPPEHVEAFVRADAGWVRAAAPEGKELRLGPGDRLRLASGLFALELSTQPPPSKARGTFVRNLDLRLLAILGAILAALLGMLASLPPHLPARPQEKEAVRYVQAKIEQAKKEPPKPKKEKPKPRPEEAQAVEAQRPEAPLQEARTYKAAATQLKSLDKITKATKGISTLLASLQGPPPTGKKGGSPSGLPLLPTFGAAPSAVLGLGGVGSGGAVGPVTRGSEVLRGGTLGALGGASAGKGGGAVGGLPVSIPKRPAKVQGAIDRDAVGAVVNKHYDEIRGCYERALLGDPNIGPGKVTLEWDIALDGRVSGVRTKVATLKSPDAIRCMLDLIQSLDFPKPQGGLVIVTFPFMFNSVGY